MSIIIFDSTNIFVIHFIIYQGFEDVLLLDELMERYNSDFSKVLPKFSELRCEDAHAICDLAMYNYVEVILLLFYYSLNFYRN